MFPENFQNDKNKDLRDHRKRDRSSSETSDSDIESDSSVEENLGSEKYPHHNPKHNMDMNIADDMQVALLSAMAQSHDASGKSDLSNVYDFSSIHHSRTNATMTKSEVEKTTECKVENILNIDYSSSDEEANDNVDSNQDGDRSKDVEDTCSKVADQESEDDSDVESVESSKEMVDKDVEEDFEQSVETSEQSHSNSKVVGGNEKTHIIAPKTENEVNAYAQFTSQEDIDLLSKMVDFQIKEEEKLMLKQIIGVEGSNSDRNTEPKLDVQSGIKMLAGTIKNHLVMERTIVIESAVNTPPLDEGTLLVVEVPEHNRLNYDKEHERTSNTENLSISKSSPGQKQIVPLGKVFEAFGPVLRPFYTIRLPAPMHSSFRSSREQAKYSESETNEKLPRKLKPSLKSVDDNEDDAKNESDPYVENTKQSPKSHDYSLEKSKVHVEGDAVGQNASLNPVPSIVVESHENNLSNGKSANRKDDDCKDVSSNLQEDEKDIGKKQNNSRSDWNSSTLEEVARDPWSVDGYYTKFVRQNPFTPVYYLQTSQYPNPLTAMIDTKAIVRMSVGKGCDASNFYDEELDANEIDFSDDEEERKAKAALKKKKNKNKRYDKDKNFSRHNSQPVNHNSRRSGNRGRGRGSMNFNSYATFSSNNYRNSTADQQYHFHNGNSQFSSSTHDVPIGLVPQQGYPQINAFSFQHQNPRNMMNAQGNHYFNSGTITSSNQHDSMLQQEYQLPQAHTFYPQPPPPPPPPPPPSNRNETTLYDYTTGN